MDWQFKIFPLGSSIAKLEIELLKTVKSGNTHLLQSEQESEQQKNTEQVKVNIVTYCKQEVKTWKCKQ